MNRTKKESDLPELYKEKKHFIESEPVIEMKEQVIIIVGHTVVIIIALLSIYFIHVFLDKLLGKDEILLGFIKVKYIIDAGDLAVLLSWLLVVVFNSYKIIWKMLKKK